MENSIAKEYNLVSLLKFALPTIVMMVFMSIYSIIDGIFVARFVSINALSAVNIVYPILSTILAMGLMLATGGSAIIAKKIGEEKLEEARKNFTLIILVGTAIGLGIMLLGLLFIKPILSILGANKELFYLSHEYATTFLFFTPLAILQMLFLNFFITAGRPKIGLALTVIGGCANIVLDYYFIVTLGMGLMGAALATGIGMAIPAVIGLFYFSFYRKGILYLVRPQFDTKVLVQTCINGSSEMVTNLSLAIVTLLYNLIMMKYLGIDGVAAITVLLYTQFLLTAIFLGFSMGVAPIISYNYGSQNIIQIKRIFKYSMIFTFAGSLAAFVNSLLFAPFLIQIFAQKASNVYTIALDGFTIFSISFLFSGFNIFSSAMFTAFSNGKVSAIISFMRTFVFIAIGLLLLPLIMGVTGAWWAITLAEFLSMLMCLLYLIKYKKRYSYM
ncbi:MATE efflux family protein [Alkaliphilus metalliredigens QYMF]|uniref:MATE efflux family protein n=1 Tax=Alkaliphilus metalliredigens (strain QYMF) TaxID=293826 RepID=A6TKX4_ALKMQ|nr:MATE family efflux transporter [Alkaliphilus metalliredigens]ABR46842.1 MATE efflux family protein [Alkaliphilus metalliredigens QYMF]